MLELGATGVVLQFVALARGVPIPAQNRDFFLRSIGASFDFGVVIPRLRPSSEPELVGAQFGLGLGDGPFPSLDHLGVPVDFVLLLLAAAQLARHVQRAPVTVFD